MHHVIQLQFEKLIAFNFSTYAIATKKNMLIAATEIEKLLKKIYILIDQIRIQIFNLMW